MNQFVLQPMSTAPIPKDDEYFQLLVLEQYTDSYSQELIKSWSLVYWLDAFDGRPAGWYGNHCTDLRNPIGWILSTSSLPIT